MPQLGDVRKGNYIWAACVECGKERWTDLRHGKPRFPRCKSCSVRGRLNPHWTGGQHLSGDGYMLIIQKDHPRANRGYVKRARLVLEQKLGRYLLDGEVPHHTNGIRTDDRPENLEELSNSEHASLHMMGNQYWKKRTRSDKWDALRPVILALRLEGLTMRAIGMEIGVGASTVWRKLREA